jgi:anti-sigma factor RsiW
MASEERDRMTKMLSAYLDGELTQADQQRVRLYLESSDEGRREFEAMATLKNLTADLRFQDPADTRLDEIQLQLSVQTPRRFGWSLLLLTLLAWAIYAIILVVRNPRWPTAPEMLAGGVVAGLACLFFSVLRQRLLERPFDRYRKVRR